jgi:hypothetical protein
MHKKNSAKNQKMHCFNQIINYGNKLWFFPMGAKRGKIPLA